MDAMQTATDNSHITVTSLKADYFQSIQKNGLLNAHHQTLMQIKEWLDHDPYYRSHPEAAAKQAVRLHTQCIFMAAFEQNIVPPIRDLDNMFVHVFGESGRAVIH